METWERYWGSRRQRVLSLPRLLFNKLFILELTRHVRGSRMLEVGSGTSICMSLLRDYGYKCMGIDRSELAVRQAKIANHTVVRTDAAFLPFKDKTFDIAYTQGLLEHLLDREIRRILSEMKRVARTVVFTLPPKRGFFNITEDLAGLFKVQYIFPKARYFSKKEIRSILQGISKHVEIRLFFLLTYFVIARWPRESLGARDLSQIKCDPRVYVDSTARSSGVRNASPVLP